MFPRSLDRLLSFLVVRDSFCYRSMPIGFPSAARKHRWRISRTNFVDERAALQISHAWSINCILGWIHVFSGEITGTGTWLLFDLGYSGTPLARTAKSRGCDAPLIVQSRAHCARSRVEMGRRFTPRDSSGYVIFLLPILSVFQRSRDPRRSEMPRRRLPIAYECIRSECFSVLYKDYEYRCFMQARTVYCPPLRESCYRRLNSWISWIIQIAISFFFFSSFRPFQARARAAANLIRGL